MKTRALPLIDKNTWIVNRAKGGKVLHVGCTDWPLTENRLKEGKLLHNMLCAVSSQCIGIDLDDEGITQLRILMPGFEFHSLNAEQLCSAPELAGSRWDCIVAGDVVEHMNNPGLFFESAHQLLSDGGTLIVTVPVSFSAKRFFWMLFTGREQVHPDHTAYFSESTLTRIGERNDFKIEEMFAFQWVNPTIKNRLANLLAAPFVWLSKGRCADEVAVVFSKK